MNHTVCNCHPLRLNIFLLFVSLMSEMYIVFCRLQDVVIFAIFCKSLELFVFDM